MRAVGLGERSFVRSGRTDMVSLEPRYRRELGAWSAGGKIFYTDRISKGSAQ